MRQTGPSASLPPGTTGRFSALGRVEVERSYWTWVLTYSGESLKEAVRDCLYRRPPPPIGTSRVRVRDRLRQLLAEDQSCQPRNGDTAFWDATEFDRLCDEVGGISDKGALLDFLHHSGVIFYRAGLFGGRIVSIRIGRWRPSTPSLTGRNTYRCFGAMGDLTGLISKHYLVELYAGKQKVFLGMMESCGICFKVRKLRITNGNISPRNSSPNGRTRRNCF